MGLLKYFMPYRVGKVTSNKSIGQITSELEDVTVMETESNLNAKSMDDNGKSFFLVDKKEQLYYLEPLPKISGIKQAGFIPYTKVKLLTDERSLNSGLSILIISRTIRQGCRFAAPRSGCGLDGCFGILKNIIKPELGIRALRALSFKG